MAVSKTNVAGWDHVCLTREEFAELMVQDCIENNKHGKTKRPKLAFSMNGQAISLASSNKEFGLAVKKADYLQADGQSLVFASRFFSKRPLPERIATTDFFHNAAAHAIKNNLSFYMLGASEEELNDAIVNVKKMYPELKIAGYRNGYFSEEEVDFICNDIIKSGADVLWVGLGKPKEQNFCVNNLEKLHGISWIKTCGGLFDFLSGKNQRAPQWMQDVGLEWLHRTILSPRRFFVRYLFTNVHTIFIILSSALRDKK